jgi:hypothetical protein
VLNRQADEEVEYAVTITSLCQALHCLPRPGGLLDQDAHDVLLMQAVLIAQEERVELDRKRLHKAAGGH